MQAPRRFTVNLSPPKSPKFSVVVAFDDDNASSPALKTCDYVIQQLGHDVPVRRIVLHLREGRQTRSRQSAARSAANADMIILGADESRELSPQVREWLTEWSGQRGAEEGAFVAVLNRSGSAPISQNLREELRQVADAAHMDFFSSQVVGS